MIILQSVKDRLSTIVGKTGQHKDTMMVCSVALLVALVATACSAGNTSDNSTPTPISADIQDVLTGNHQFSYTNDDGSNLASVSIADLPALFNPDDDYMAIQNYVMVDLDGDGVEEAVLLVVGVAGDTGGYLVLHRIDDNVYGYRTGYRTFENLKTDGTFGYSDNIGAKEGVAIIGFTENSFVMNDVLSATGQAYTMDTFMVNGEEVTEEEYNAAKEAQTLKSDVEWHEFSMP